ncbi:MAG: glycosyltransferase family 4 protein [Phoenicibacter congonensis]|uniref:Glycosyltransferase family 4 protein n=1 Tax=Phoenicibacter congonensis TaxID=1944646 RepID=A0AA43RH16_9ACTN|nr:glycosyltransferase family 4 protein [Phoenicibacter congonensis]
MRILSVTAQKPTSTGSGVYLTEVIKQLRREGHKQAIIYGRMPDDPPMKVEDEVEASYPVTFMQGDLNFPIAGMSDNMPYRSTRYCDFNDEMTRKFAMAYFLQISKAITEFKPDLIICHHLYLVTAIVTHVNKTLLGNAKVVAICHGTDIRQMKKHELCRQYIKEGMRYLDQVYVLHNDQFDDIKDTYGVRMRRIDTIGTGFNADVFSTPKTEKNRMPHRIVYAGKICKQKGVPQLIEACENLATKIDDLELILAGGYSNKEEYDEIYKLGKNAKLNLTFTGQVHQSELAELYQTSKVFCLPSFFEGLPLVTLEAMACGCSCVMTDLPGIRQWYTENVKDSPLIFVQTPKMSNVDVPVLSDLPVFTKNLENALADAMTMEGNPEAVSELSWHALATRLIEKTSRL